MTYLVIANEYGFPKNCGECPISTSNVDGYCEWCAVLQKEIKNRNKKMRGCPIKGTVKKKDIIKYTKEKEDDKGTIKNQNTTNH